MGSSHKQDCSCVCHKGEGIIISIVGLVFLLGNLEIISSHIVGIIWPSLLILAGLKKAFGKGMCKCCDKG